MIVWALYDDGNCSWYKALKDIDNVKVYSIGINDVKDIPNYIQIDLSIHNKKLIKQLSKIEHPDIIVCSPPCESWSNCDNQQRLLKSIEKKNNDEITLNFRTFSFYENHNKTCAKQMIRNYYKSLSTCLSGIATINAVHQIIHHFKPKYYVIENPQSSLIWKYIDACLDFDYATKWLVYYNNYDTNYSRKPTYFMTNAVLKLKHDTFKSEINLGNITGYDKRSSIPKELLLDIYKQISKE